MTLLNLVFNFTNVTFTHTLVYLQSIQGKRKTIILFIYTIIIDKSDHQDTGEENDGSEKNEEDTSEKDDKEKMFTYYQLSMYMTLIFFFGVM